LDGLTEAFQRLDFDRLRLRKPSKTVFFCGGKLGKLNEKPAFSVRDFLLRHRALFRTINCNVVLAEDATQLYRDSKFRDLISFEEGVAQVAALILIVAESPGALAELGAFTLSEAISPHLKVIVDRNYERDESFIRHGPLRRLQNAYDGSVSFYPWSQIKSSGYPTKRSLGRIYGDLKALIQGYVNAAPQTIGFRDAAANAIYYVTYWVVFLGTAMPQGKVIEAVRDCIPEATEELIINALYVLQMVKWIKLEAYGPYRYYFSLFNHDSLQYAFTGPKGARDSARFISDVSTILKRETAAPVAIIRTAIESRR
jgi:hypothetical protein